MEDTRTGGANSNAGAFGFYTWIEPTKANYAMLARTDVVAKAGAESVLCGRKLRLACATEVIQ